MTLASNSQIAVIGSSSMVGSRFCELSDQNFKLVKADLNDNVSIDITDKESVENFFQNNKFDAVILFSAFTDVDGAEKQRGDNQGLCWKINVDGVRNIVGSCRQHNKKLIFISTDFVFDGKNGPYSENDPVATEPNLVSWYGLSKIEGEKIIEENLQDYIILRISYPYRANFPQKPDLFRKILDSYKQNNLFPMFDDQKLTPTFIDDLAAAIKALLEKDQRGIFHLASPQVSTPFEIAKFLIKTFNGDPNVVKSGSLVEFMQSGSAKTPRPVNGGLKVDKISSFGVTPTDWQKGIVAVHNQSEGETI
jgi:dTDP-4-dehydrorhamnose reductase